MSSRDQLQRAVRKAENRDRKRKIKMKVTGKSVFGLSRLVDRKRG